MTTAEAIHPTSKCLNVDLIGHLEGVMPTLNKSSQSFVESKISELRYLADTIERESNVFAIRRIIDLMNKAEQLLYTYLPSELRPVYTKIPAF